jgi:hypothetical protein
LNKYRKVILISLGVIAVSLVLFFTIQNYQKKLPLYNKYLEQYSISGDSELYESYKSFQSLGSFKDSRRIVSDIMSKMDQLYNQNIDYSDNSDEVILYESYKAFLVLGDFKDSREYADNIKAELEQYVNYIDVVLTSEYPHTDTLNTAVYYIQQLGDYKNYSKYKKVIEESYKWSGIWKKHSGYLPYEAFRIDVINKKILIAINQYVTQEYDIQSIGDDYFFNDLRFTMDDPFSIEVYLQGYDFLYGYYIWYES